MKMYLVYQDEVSNILREERCNLMLSYAAIAPGKSEVEIPEGFPEVMLDSGGFQLQTGVKGKRDISITGYASWLHYGLEKYPEIVAYMNMDAPSNYMKTLENQHYLESEGLHPLPIWHADEGDKLLDYYVNLYPYVAIGAIARGANKKVLRGIVERILTRYPDHKFHLLGMGLNASTALVNVRPYSIDFSTWMASFRFGNDLVWGKDYLLHEKFMDAEWRSRIQTDKAFKLEQVRKTIRNLKKYTTILENYKSDFQSQFDLMI